MAQTRCPPFVAVTAAGVLWATSGPIAEAVPVAALVLTELRLFMGALALAIYLGPARLIRLVRSADWRLLIAAAAGMAGFQWTFFVAVAAAGASFATWGTVASGPVAAWLMAMRGSPRLAGRDCVAAAVALAGVGLIGVGAHASVSDLCLVLAGGFGYAVYASAASRVGEEAGNALLVTTFSLGGGAVLLLPLVWASAPVDQLAHWHGVDLARVMFLGLGSTALAYVLFARGACRIGAQKALSLQWVQPVITELFLSAAPGHVQASPVYWLGEAAILVSLCSAGVAPSANGFFPSQLPQEQS